MRKGYSVYIQGISATFIEVKRFASIFLISLAFFAFYGDESFAGQRRSNVISPSQARQIAQERFGGKAVATTFVEAGDNSAYRVKIIKAGRVCIVTIPARK